MNQQDGLFVLHSTVRLYLALIKRVVGFDGQIGTPKYDYSDEEYAFSERANLKSIPGCDHAWQLEIDEMIRRCETVEEARSIQTKLFHDLLGLDDDLETRWQVYNTVLMYAWHQKNKNWPVKDAVVLGNKFVIGLVWLEYAHDTAELINWIFLANV